MKTLTLFLFVVTAVTCLKIEEKPVKNVRIINGAAAEAKEFPYMAAIYKTTDLGRYFCGGAIIGTQWILTAAYCVLDAASFSIQVGSVNLTGTDDNRVTVNATNFTIHPDFDSESLVNNIALINLSEELTFNEFVNAIGLPTEALEDNVALTVIGWGQTDDAHSGPVNGLNKVEVISYLNDHCKNFYGDQITEEMVCAMGSYNEGTCTGDIGGPLINQDNGTDVHVGIASFLSFNGCETTEPSGFERTFSHLDWIKSVTGIA